MSAPAAFVEDIVAAIGPAPILLHDLIYDLRHGDTPSRRRWRNVRADEVERIARDHGAHFASRAHGAGLAVYLAAAPFAAVEHRGRAVPVWPY